MAKKKRTTKRSTKARKRRPAPKQVAAKRGAFQSGAFQSGAFQGLPPSASERKLSAAVQSTVGEVRPPHVLSAGTGEYRLNQPIIGTPALSVMPGTSSLTADAFVIPAPIKAVIVDRLSKQPVDIRDAARAYAPALRREAERLRSHRPNDRSEHELAKYDDLVRLLENMAAGLTDLAAALDEANKSAGSDRFTTAAQIAHNLQRTVVQWLENNVGSRIGMVFDVALFTGGVLFLHHLGADSIAAIGALGMIVRGGGKRKDPPKKKGEPPKKKRR